MFRTMFESVANEFKISVDDLCFNISTGNFDLSFSFYAFETDEFLGVVVTDENGDEKLHVLVKNKIEFIQFVYQDDFDLLFDFDDTPSRDVKLHE